MASVCLKRLTKERERFTKDDSEFWVNWNDSDLRKFDAYIIGPDDSVYKHKLIKLHFDIPDQYPFVPPKVTFIQHTGERVHPNLYVEGKVCLSILGTWTGPGWSQNMNVESVLVTVRSLLDQKPYMHEPNQSDRPEFNAYVRYHGWQWLLLDYLERETDQEAKAWLDRYLVRCGTGIIDELERQRESARVGSQVMGSPYGVRSQGQYVVDYQRLIADLKAKVPKVSQAPKVVAGEPTEVVNGLEAMKDASLKRKLPLAAVHAVPPAKKRAVVDLEDQSDDTTSNRTTEKPAAWRSMEVIDLTDD